MSQCRRVGLNHWPWLLRSHALPAELHRQAIFTRTKKIRIFHFASFRLGVITNINCSLAHTDRDRAEKGRFGLPTRRISPSSRFRDGRFQPLSHFSICHNKGVVVRHVLGTWCSLWVLTELATLCQPHLHHSMWRIQGSNLRPCPYQRHALTS